MEKIFVLGGTPTLRIPAEKYFGNHRNEWIKMNILKLFKIRNKVQNEVSVFFVSFEHIQQSTSLLYVFNGHFEHVCICWSWMLPFGVGVIFDHDWNQLDSEVLSVSWLDFLFKSHFGFLPLWHTKC